MPSPLSLPSSWLSFQRLLPAPHQMDIRSLTLYRILLAVYLGQDLFGRLYHNGWRISLHWYTSATTENDNTALPPIFDPTDVVVHENAWLCVRGTTTLQGVLMIVHALLIVGYGLGIGIRIATRTTPLPCVLWMLVPTALWISSVSLMCRSPPDNFLNDLGDVLGPAHIFWSIFVPHLGAVSVWNVVTTWRRNQTSTARPTKTSSFVCETYLSTTNIGNSPLSMDINTASTTTPTLRQRHRPEKYSNEVKPRRDKDNNSNTTKACAAANLHQSTSTAIVATTLSNLPTYHYRPVSGLPCLAISLQILIVYLSIIYARLEYESWWYPDLSAVYYAFSCLRYTRPVMAEFAQNYVTLTRIMTFGTLIVELGCPILCFLAPYDAYQFDKESRRYVRTRASWRAIPALVTTGFHLTLWACIRIPALQIICASVPVVWIPGSFWDQLGVLTIGHDSGDGLMRESPMQQPITITTMATRYPYNLKHPQASLGWWERTKDWVRMVMLLGMIPSMLANWAVAMEWSREKGIVGKLSKLSKNLFMEQEWGIYKSAPGAAVSMIITGNYQNAEARDARKDILAAWRTNDWSNRTDISFETYARWSATMNVNMSAQFGHWRIESFLTEPDLQNHDHYSVDWSRIDRWQYFVCKWANSELAKANDPRGSITEIEMLIQFAKLIPPGFPGRFHRTDDAIFSYSCEEEPREDQRGRGVQYPQSTKKVFDPFTMEMLEESFDDESSDDEQEEEVEDE